MKHYSFNAQKLVKLYNPIYIAFLTKKSNNDAPKQLYRKVYTT